MTVIELIGHVNERGELEFAKPAHLPPGDVRIIIETLDAATEAADEALWQEQFAKTPSTLDYLEKLGLEAFEADELEDLNIDQDLEDDDLPPHESI